MEGNMGSVSAAGGPKLQSNPLWRGQRPSRCNAMSAGGWLAAWWTGPTCGRAAKLATARADAKRGEAHPTAGDVLGGHCRLAIAQHRPSSHLYKKRKF